MSEEFQVIPGPADAEGDVSTYYVPNLAVAVSNDESQPRTNAVKEVTNFTQDIYEWGEDNLEPQNVIKSRNENDLLGPAIEKKAKLIYGQGLYYGPIEMMKTSNGVEEVVRPTIVPEIEDFKEDSAINTYLREASVDKFTFGNFFPEVILGKYTTRAHKLYCIDASECRLSLQDVKTGAINKVHVSANWDTFAAQGTGKRNVIKVDALDPYGALVDQIKSKPFVKKFIIPMRAQNLGEKYYAKDPLYGLRKSGWLDIAKAVPAWKKAVMNNQLTIKYHLKIAVEWWDWKYPGFSEKKSKEKQTIMKKEIAAFLKAVKGTDKAGNVIMSAFRADPRSGERWDGWIIEPINNTKFDATDNHLEYASEADLRIIRALGMHPTLFGASKSKGSAGSGSDIRVAMNQAILECKPEQDEILRPLQLVSRLNGWNEKYGGMNKRLGWVFKSYYIARLDSGKEISKEAEGQTNNADES